MKDLIIDGMHGLGDNLHQRAVVRYYMRDHRVFLNTPWPQVYEDLVGQNLVLNLPERITLRTQAKNAISQAGAYRAPPPPRTVRAIKVSYSPHSVRTFGSVLGAMLAETGVPREYDDFRMPVPEHWGHNPLSNAFTSGKPLMVYRPLIERTEWKGCHARNPDAYAYGTLASGIASQFNLASIADLEPGKEWIAGADIDAEIKLHAGELDFRRLAVMVKAAALAFTSPGFIAPLAQAVGTPVCVVFGGYENSRSFSAGAKWAPYLGIDTKIPCDCFQHEHPCVKSIDMAMARQKLANFVNTSSITMRRKAA